MEKAIFSTGRRDRPSRRSALLLSRRGRRGTALITSVICILLLETLGAAVLSLSLTGMNLAEHVRRTAVSFNVAESGAERAARWIKDQASPPTGTSAIDPFGGTQTLGAGTYSVSILPDPGNPGADRKEYTISSTATVQSRQQQVKLVVKQSSFGKYAYFTDKEVSSITGGSIWFFGRDHIRGPAHSNNSDGGTMHVDWTAADSTNPIFQGPVTTSASSITYQKSGATANPASESDYLQIYKTGSRGFNLGVDPVPLPTSTSLQQTAAWGASSGFPTTNGVYVPNSSGVISGGIYIVGDAGISMQLDASGNQQFVVTQGSTITTITVDLVANVIRQQVGAGPVTTYTNPTGSPPGSGVLYCSGNVTSLSGTVADNYCTTGSPPTVLARSAYTIATDVGNGKNITITNPITYNSAPDPTLPTTDPTNLHPGTLGLVARNVTVASGTPSQMEIDAEMLSGRDSTTYPSDTDGSFSVADYSTKAPGSSPNWNQLKIVGGVIQRARGPVGTLNSDGTPHSGYTKNYYYDTRMADSPPPFFPTTGSYDRISWRKMAG
jgi:hypothetical protein